MLFQVQDKHITARRSYRLMNQKKGEYANGFMELVADFSTSKRNSNEESADRSSREPEERTA